MQLNSVQFRINLFCVRQTQKGLRPTGYRTCQSVYIVIRTKQTI